MVALCILGGGMICDLGCPGAGGRSCSEVSDGPNIYIYIYIHMPIYIYIYPQAPSFAGGHLLSSHFQPAFCFVSAVE